MNLFGKFYKVSVIFGISIFCLLFAFSRFIWNDQNELSPVKDLLIWKAAKPFQFRVLVPLIVSRIYDLELIKTNFPTPYPIFFLVEFLSIFGLFFSFKIFVARFIENSFLKEMAPFLLFYSLSFNFVLPRHNPFWYPWDLPSLLFFTIGLTALKEENWKIFYPLFCLATFNRETTLFLTFISFFIMFPDWRKIFLHCGFQSIVWTAIKIILNRIFWENPGAGLFEPHLWDNCRAIVSISAWKELLPCAGFLWIPVLLGFPAITDFFLRRSLLVCVPFFASMMVVGNIDEIRIFGEIIPLIVVAFLWLAENRFLKIRQEEKQNNTSSVF